MSMQQTLYQIAESEIRKSIDVYLELARASNGLTAILPEHLVDDQAKIILMAGLGLLSRPATAEEVHLEWQRRQAVPFELESAITTSVYSVLRTVGERFYDELSVATDHFTHFRSEYIFANPHYLPLFQHLGGIFSKSKLKEYIGSVSDKKISKPAAERLANLLCDRIDPEKIIKGEILQRLESTLEGIIRDLVGRVLLESIVATALHREKLPFMRENQYESLSGIVYDFRADFLLPNATSPKVFIEVRKSSARHASLYAKDKMFSAINWKGKTRDLLAILVVDGPWTGETLRIMANVFDYVVPIGRIDNLVRNIKAYLDGDRTILKWLIDFHITSANESGSARRKLPR